MSSFLITNGGPHPADKWAVATAEIIFDTSSMPSSDRLLDAKKLQLQIVEALLPHHEGAQERERGHLAGGRHEARTAHLAEVNDGGAEALAEADEAIAAIQAIKSDLTIKVDDKDVPWADWARLPERVEAWRNIIASHFMSAKHIEHSWHKDRAEGRAPAA